MAFTFTDSLKAWGTSAIPPMTLTTLIIALHARPLQPFPLLFAPMLTFSSYLTLAGFKIDGAGTTAAWSGIYFLLASRRRSTTSGSGFSSSLRQKFFSLRGGVRGTAMGLAAANAISGAYVYATGNRKEEEKERKEIDRWGMYNDK